MSRAGVAHRLNAQFIDSGDRRIFVTEFVPLLESGVAVLVCPPFAEELNKSRRMLAMLGRALARQGQRVLIPDLYGTGDSEGEFEQATLETWLTDIRNAARWLQSRGARSIVLLGLRFGALLALRSAVERAFPCEQILLWQPLASGRTFIRQFLRVAVAADLQSAQSRSTDAMRAALERDGRIEVAGYSLDRSLVASIESLSLDSLGAQVSARIDCIEINATQDTNVSAALQRVCQGWRERAIAGSCEAMPGDPFWITAEISTVPALITRTAEMVNRQ